jgi:UDP-N-acetylglucosamine diphosphorylase/glucosamine-1-phosphate N-acetyltransferase
MNIVLCDVPGVRVSLLPFTYTRPVAGIRCGIFTLAERWEHITGQPATYFTQDYLSKKFLGPPGNQHLLIQGALVATPRLWEQLQNLRSHQVLTYQGQILGGPNQTVQWQELEEKEPVEAQEAPLFIDAPWKIFKHTAQLIRADFALLTKGRKSAGISDPYTRVYGEHQLFVEEGAEVRAAIINADAGPVYLGKNTTIHEGALIRGSLALCEGSQISMGAKLRGDSTIGPYCKVGGEISNSVLFGYSNKAHDGFLGNSVLGEWCNIGADTNTSNMKNNYENVKVWDYGSERFADTGELFCGLLMGDHSKCGINTMFNTGTVVGVGANIFGEGFPRNFIPSFAWGGAAGFTTFQITKAMVTATKVMERRQLTLTEIDRGILEQVFQNSAPQRVWEKKQ